MRTLFILFIVLAAPAYSQCLNPMLSGVEYQATGPELISPQSFNVQAAGAQLAPCSDGEAHAMIAQDLNGYWPDAPTAQFQLAGMGPHILMVMSQASCGSVLAVRDGSGVWYAGETANGREEITLWGQGDGMLQVWVGSADAQGCSGTLILETFDR